MDGQEYLSQISADLHPAKSSNNGGILHSKFFLVGMVGLVLLILIIMLGSLLGGAKGDEKSKSISLKLHIDNTAEVIKEYQTYIKSSQLRSDSASLYGVLTNSSKALGTYLEDKYKIKDKDIDKKSKETAEADKEKLGNELFEAKINGILDRTMAHKMSYEISIMLAEESTLIKMTKNENLEALLTESYNSLKNLYDKFNNFSEGE